MYRRIRTLFPEKVNSFGRTGERRGNRALFFKKGFSLREIFFAAHCHFITTTSNSPCSIPVRGWYRAGSRDTRGRVGWGVEKEIGTFYVYFTLFYFLTRQSGFPYKEVAIKFQSIGKTRPPAGGEAHVGDGIRALNRCWT